MSERRGNTDDADARDAAQAGRGFWRSLGERARLDDAEAFIRRESPRHAALLENALDRRAFLKLMGASLALAGVTACGARMPVEEIVPYVRQPEGVTPGQTLFYATAVTHGGYAQGLLVESHEGRPTKVEGNPNHPASLGATDAFAQASVLALYDPDRSQTVAYLGEISSWGEFLVALRRALAPLRGKQGAGLRVLTETVTSPTLADQLKGLLTDFPRAVWHQWEPAGRDNARAGATMAFGTDADAIHHFDKADVVLSLGADFLSQGAGAVRHARDFMARRRVRAAGAGAQAARMNRLYVVECTPSCTGAVADHRLPARASEIRNVALAVAAGLGVPSVQTNAGAGATTSAATGETAKAHAGWIASVVRDLDEHRGASLVVVGDEQPPLVHALAHAVNQHLGNVGQTISYIEPVEANPTDQLASLRQLVGDMGAGQVELLVIVGGNPVYNAPADFAFADAMQKVPLRVHHGLYYDETSAFCHWHIPAAHYLETWSDARAYDGTASIIQPLIAPLYAGKSAHELLAAFSAGPDRPSYDIVRAYWQRGKGQTTTGSEQRPTQVNSNGGAQANGDDARQASNARQTNNAQRTSNAQQNNGPAATQAPSTQASKAAAQFDAWWSGVLRDGVVPGTAAQTKMVTLKTDWAAQATGTSNPQATQPNQAAQPNAAATSSALEIVFQTDPSVHDGRYANNGWLQELPKPLTKITWDNVALVSPATAKRLGISEDLAGRGGEHGQMIASVVELRYGGRTVRAPAWIMPGHADESVTVYLGYGRTRAGSVGTDRGFNAYLLRPSAALSFAPGLEVRNTGETYALACTQAHHSMEGRDLVRSASLDEYHARPDFARTEADDPKQAISLYPGWKYEGYAWGMAIDTSTCVGCNACVVACQAENNIPVVGREEVMHAREMHWLRIDRYYAGALENPQIVFQPVPCQHCENAPCELVCPVEATSHSSEGLNEMTYNRCVGTRYCSNNCPYKVRRFNFFEYADYQTPVVKLQRNPEVTVRSRGVMEKCTYCVQRIQYAKINAEREGRDVRDGEIMTACQQACPTEAIIFGNINDPEARVSKLKREPTNYGLLAELNTRPRTTYLATVRNPNPEIKSE
jgi:molybdopterin-containing oxidoreductase family iron-sulfur binding subunit